MELIQIGLSLHELTEGGFDPSVVAAVSGRSATFLKSQGFDAATLSMRKKVATEQGAAPEELLSEAWKESEDGDGAGFPLVQAAGAIALAIGLVAFSQVPIGQDTTDLSSFGGRAPTLETPMQIKARYETLGIYEEGSE